MKLKLQNLSTKIFLLNYQKIILDNSNHFSLIKYIYFNKLQSKIKQVLACQ